MADVPSEVAKFGEDVHGFGLFGPVRQLIFSNVRGEGGGGTGVREDIMVLMGWLVPVCVIHSPPAEAILGSGENYLVHPVRCIWITGVISNDRVAPDVKKLHLPCDQIIFICLARKGSCSASGNWTSIQIPMTRNRSLA